EPSVLGHSIGRFDGAALVIDTARFTPGVITQYTEDAQGNLAGVLHSDAYRVTERLAVDPASGELHVTWVHEDPKWFTRTFRGGPIVFVRRSDLQVGEYNCQPDP